MEELLIKLNIIEDINNETYIGRADNIIQLFLEMIKYDIDTIGNAEETIANIKEKIEFLEELQKEFDMRNSAIIKVNYHPMGSYNYSLV